MTTFKSLIIGFLIGLIFSIPITTQAHSVLNLAEHIDIRKISGWVKTTKVTVEEGTYRLFIYDKGYGAGITAIKIK